MITYKDLLEKKMTGDDVKKQHEKWLKDYQKKGCDKKALHKKYLKSGFMSQNTDFDVWEKYMKDEIKARK